MSKVVLECNNITKKINKKTIISDISFKLYEKDILGFIGPNGAGKTTIIKSILGLYNINEGTIIINNNNLSTNFVDAIKEIGAIIENPDLYSYLTGYENLMISANIYNISENKVEEIINKVGLEKSIHKKVSKYSLGMKQRLGIAQAILHNPKILILDEPTNGLDPKGIIDLNLLLKDLASSGMAIIISSHILNELETLCNKFCFINGGKLVAYKTIKELKEINIKTEYILELSTNNLKRIIKNYKIIDKNHIRIKTTSLKLNKIINKLVKNNISIYEIKKESSSLEKLFLNIMEGDYIV